MNAYEWGIASGVQMNVVAELPIYEHHNQFVVAIYVNGKKFDVTTLGLPYLSPEPPLPKVYNEVLTFLFDFYIENITIEDFHDMDNIAIENHLWSKRFIEMLDPRDRDDFVMGIMDFED